jgi:hypothetical protein
LTVAQRSSILPENGRKSMKNLALAITFAAALGGCAPVVWDKPGVTPAQFSAENAQCQLMAEGVTPPTEAADFQTGSWKRDAAADVGADLAAGIARGISVNHAYTLCMQAKGYVEHTTAAAAGPASAPADASQAQVTPTSELAAKLQPIFVEFGDCFNRIYGLPESAPLRARLPLKPNDASQAQLSDQSKINDQEIASFDLLIPKQQICQKHLLEQLSGTAPSLAPIISASDAEAIERLNLLRERKVTWGDYNALRKQRAADLTLKLRAAITKSGA